MIRCTIGFVPIKKWKVNEQYHLVVIHFWSSKKQIDENLILETLECANSAKTCKYRRTRPQTLTHFFFLKLDAGIHPFGSNLYLGVFT